MKRTTSETKISLSLTIDGAGNSKVETGIAFFDHMLDQLARHSSMDIDLTARGDLEIDTHHTVEDVGLALGEAISTALGEKTGIARYGHSIVPMEDALVLCAIDLSGRPYLARDIPVPVEKVGDLDVASVNEFFRAVVNRGGLTLHSRLLDGTDPHHIIEGEFKAFAVALSRAIAVVDGRGVPSTKGVLE